MSKSKPSKSGKKPENDKQLIEPTIEDAIMQIIQAESTKAQLSVPHMLTLGQLRERIFRKTLVEIMPRKVSIDTGLITHTEFDYDQQRVDTKHSKQLDLLLHDHFNHATLYQLDDFVVCTLEGALAGIEIKSQLNRTTFDEIIAVNLSIRDLSSHPAIDGFGYALKGSNFKKFRSYISDTVVNANNWKHQLATLPIGICCQDQNYVCLRPSMTNDNNDKHFAFCARPRSGKPGWALMVFILVLRVYAANEMNYERENRMPHWMLYNWYNNLSFGEFEKWHIGADGEWCSGEKHVPPVLSRK